MNTARCFYIWVVKYATYTVFNVYTHITLSFKMHTPIQGYTYQLFRPTTEFGEWTHFCWVLRVFKLFFLFFHFSLVFYLSIYCCCFSCVAFSTEKADHHLCLWLYNAFYAWSWALYISKKKNKYTVNEKNRDEELNGC